MMINDKWLVAFMIILTLSMLIRGAVGKDMIMIPGIFFAALLIWVL
jgi:hypothetical protein